jgi:hypothetical protein
MEDLIFTTRAVLEAFAPGRGGATKAAAEFGITRSAVHQWPKDGSIPGKWKLHLYLKRPDIIEKIKAKQGTNQAHVMESVNGKDQPPTPLSEAGTIQCEHIPDHSHAA